MRPGESSHYIPEGFYSKSMHRRVMSFFDSNHNRPNSNNNNNNNNNVIGSTTKLHK